MRVERLALLLEFGAPSGGFIVIERQQQRGDRQFAAAVDADMHDILGVELEVEPRAAIRNDPRGEQELA